MAIDQVWNKIKQGEPFFIAEAGVNHLQDWELAERLIKGAKEGGADAIKWQTYKAKELCVKDAPRFWDWDGEIKKDGSQYDSYKELDGWGEEEHIRLKQMCDDNDIIFMSTPFDNKSADYLEDMGMYIWKIASCDCVNYPFVEHVASKGGIVCLSTGASDIEEIEEAVLLILKHTSKLVVMHCNLKYPTEDHETNLGMIKHLKSRFGDKAIYGLSDHTMNVQTPSFAYMLGASVFERHFTIDKTLGKSADHWLSVTPDELSDLIGHVKLAQTMHGKSIKECTDSEQRTRTNTRRSIVAYTDIKKGDVLTHENLALKRPGIGLPPKLYNNVIGKIATRDLTEDTLLTEKDYANS